MTGTGHAMNVHSSVSDDYIYTGKGTSSFAGFTTDADTAFIRQKGEIEEVTLLGGSFLKYQDTPWINMSKRADYVTVKKEGNTLDYRIQSGMDLRGTLFGTQIDPSKIQNSPAAKEQKNTAINGSSSGTNSGNTFDLVAFVKQIGKKVISFFNVKI